MGEYVDKVRDYAPDVLRRLAKNFSAESDEVKIQTLNLAAKLVITNPEVLPLILSCPLRVRVRVRVSSYEFSLTFLIAELSVGSICVQPRKVRCQL